MSRIIPLPINEGPEPSNPSFLKIMSHEEFPFDPGNLERDAFTYLSEWTQVTHAPGYGIAYRIAVKTGMPDPDGDLSDLLILFGSPIHNKYLPFDQTIEHKLYDKMQFIMQAEVVKHAHVEKPIIGIVMDPPPYMFEELEYLLREDRLSS